MYISILFFFTALYTLYTVNDWFDCWSHVVNLLNDPFYNPKCCIQLLKETINTKLNKMY